ncbi:MAG TPA: 50S ribosomal protein L28 [Candidatus Berkiella sp.]|nr:50S ribosomal protein L28 [Candidatus Berkiella sp.]
MSKVCMVTGKGTARGNHVAHCNKKMKRTFQTNVHWKRFWLADENRFISLRVSARGMRTIDKKGIEAVLAELRSRGEQV